MSKIKYELKDKLLGQSFCGDTSIDVENAYIVVKKSVLGFTTCLSEKYRCIGYKNLWENRITKTTHTTNEIFKLYEDNKL